MSGLAHTSEHRVADLATRLRSELAALAEAPLWSMSAIETGGALVTLTRARNQLDELLMRSAST